MPIRKSKGPSAERFITETLDLIAERGSSRGVSLRQISERVGCAHTNVYNYYESLEDLLWAAFRRGLELYAKAAVAGLDDTLPGYVYFRRLIGNLVDFALANPGLYRFIGSDPIQPERIPGDIIATVTRMKTYFIEVVSVLCGSLVDPDDVEAMGNILLAYLDGELLSLINGRVLPDEDVVGRVRQNAERLFMLLSARTCDGIDLQRQASHGGELIFPRLEISP